MANHVLITDFESGLSITSLPGRIWQFLRRWPILPGIILVILVTTGVFAPLISPGDPFDQELVLRNAPPFWYSEYWDEQDKFEASSRLLGADHVGRDVLSRIIHFQLPLKGSNRVRLREGYSTSNPTVSLNLSQCLDSCLRMDFVL